MQITPEMLSSVPFRYAQAVLDGTIVTGLRIKQAVERFYRWIDEADAAGYYLDHSAGMKIINFFPDFLNHTKGDLAGTPFHLKPFQQFTMYNVFAWKRTDTHLRRIRSVYDKRAKKNGKSAEMAGLGIFVMLFDNEMEAEVYIGATKEDQARICWQQAKQFVVSPLASRFIRHNSMQMYAHQRIIGTKRTDSVMKPLGGDSKTQDGINAHLSIIDEYHAHKDDSVKENLESSSVQRNQPIVWHITTAGTNIQSACKRYEDSVIEVLEQRVVNDHLFIMIHDLDEEDKADWRNEANWFKANPLLGQGLDIERIREEYVNTEMQPSKVPNFQTKHLNMWVDAPTVWIMAEQWNKCKHELTDADVLAKFQKYGCYGGVDLSTTTDITAYVMLSEPDNDGERYVIPYFFCPKDSIAARSKADRVPYQYWAAEKYIIPTDGNVVDYEVVETVIKNNFMHYKVIRNEFDPYLASGIMTNLQNAGVNVSTFSQNIGNMSAPTKEFERLVLSGKIRHDGNPVLAWMLAGCQIYYDANGNMKVHKGNSNVNGRRIDGIVALLNALGGSMSVPEKTNDSIYNNPDTEMFFG